MTTRFVNSLAELDRKDKTEIIVVNNSPEEEELFEKWNKPENVTVINSGKNLGYAGGLNLGLKHALKDPDMKAVIITNNDIEVPKTLVEDFWNEDWKNKILSPVILKKDTNIVQNTGGKISLLLGGAINVNKNVPLENLEIKEIDFLSGCMMFIPRNILERVGLFDPDYLAYYEDADYCLRAKSLGYELKICEDIIIRHCHSASTSKDKGFKRYLIVRNSIMFAKKNFKFPKSTIFILMSIIRGFIQNLKYLNSYFKGVKEGLLC
jgi:GT2 family glycosyltransferase